MNNDYSTGTAGASAGDPPSRKPRSRLFWFVLALACSALTARFGVWQLSRAHQKEANETMLAERGAQPPLPADALARDAAVGAGQWQRHVVLAGQWDAAHTVYLMNRTMDERAGFLVATPLRLPDGGAVIVQRGWVPRDDADPMKPPVLATPAGPVSVQGRVAPWPPHWIEIGHGAPGPVRQNIEAASLSAETGLVLRPVTIVEEANAGNAADGLRRGWSAPGVGIATNYGYAVQWFAMSLGFLGLWVWLQFVRPRRAASSGPTPE